MLQAIVKKGKVFPENVPAPLVSNGGLLIKVECSCISAGTETMNVVNSGRSLVKRALEQPQNVRKVVDMALSDGISKTISKVRGKLEGGTATGYSISGVVIAKGKFVENFQIGDRVAAAGAGIANHAEFVDVPENLVMKIPEGLSFEHASTVTLGGIAMQGVRRLDLKLGEISVVVGAGILGLLSIQMLKASGVRVIAIDLDESRLSLAAKYGADLILNPKNSDAIVDVFNFSSGYGADGVLFTAATSSSDPLSQAFKMCKKKGKVVLVGVVGMNINREDMYQKELDFLISTSYGPGRYDSKYEEKGMDYPYSYVRWTENRNMQEYLRLLNIKSINVDEMISKVFPIEQVEEAFETLNIVPKPLITLLKYNGNQEEVKAKEVFKGKLVTSTNLPIKVGLIGAGGFATGMHLPNLSKLSDKFKLDFIVSRTGLNAKNIAEQYGVKKYSTDPVEMLNDKDIDLVLIATRHDSHAELVINSLKAGKHVFVEKPLAINAEELNEIQKFYEDGINNKPMLFTGYNRRFSKCARTIKESVEKRTSPLFINYTMNAGFIPLDHWVHESGGRIIGESCHVIDLCRFFVGHKVSSFTVTCLGNGSKFSKNDNKVFSIKYTDGSVATINYLANGSKQYQKERMEVHFDEKTIILNDYKNIDAYGVKLTKCESQISEKGQLEELDYIFNYLSGKSQNWPISLDEMIETTLLSFEIASE